MGITVREALTIGILKDARVLAGSRGLSRVIEHVDVIEMPDIRKWARPNIFFLTSFYAVKDDLEAQVNLVRLIADNGAAGLAVDAHTYLKGVPREILEVAEAQSFPVLELPDEGGYIDVITPLMEAVLSRRRLKSEFLHDLLLGNFRSPEAMIHRARFLGWPLADKRIVLIVDVDGFEDYVLRTEKNENEVQVIKQRLEALVTETVRAETTGEPIVLTKSDSIIVLPSCPHRSVDVEGFACEVAERIRRHVALILEDVTVSVGVGNACDDPADLWRSFHEAGTAVSIGHRVFGPGRVHAFRNLGLYQFLSELGADDKVREASNRILGPLVDYDRSHATQLIPTLEAYLDSGLDITRAAQRLYIHRSSVKYRLARIRQLLGVERFQGDQLAGLVLAVKGLRYLSATRWARAPGSAGRSAEPRA